MIYTLLNPFITRFKSCNSRWHITVDSTELPRILALSTRWSVSGGRYSVSNVTCKGGYDKVSLSRFICGLPKDDTRDVDHINRNRLDNRLCNLRICSHQENAYNIGLKSSNTSGYIGVYWNTEKNKWCARIRINGKKKHCGYFSSIIDAAKAYDKKAKETRGEFAVLNFPPKGGTE